MAPRSGGPSRYLAPLALAAVLIVVIVIVVSAGGSSGSSGADSGVAVSTSPGAGRTATSAVHRPRRSASTTTPGTAGGATGTTGTGTTGTGTNGTGTTGTGTTPAGTYTVASGDTFATISEATGVPVSRIERLNPGASSSDLSIGQVLKLK